jgi:tRNA(His) 5'-end guanylyltransferase
MAQSVEASAASAAAAAASTHDSMGDRMKAYERTTQVYVDSSTPYVIRLDGHTFSKFTRGFKKPFDDRSMCIRVLARLQKHHAMVNSTSIS